MSRSGTLAAHPDGAAFERPATYLGGGIAATILEWLLRIGQLARGLVYLIPGIWALRLALGRHGAAISQTRALQMIGEHRFGRGVLLGVSVCLIGYVLWGVVRALRGPVGETNLVAGLGLRLGYLTSAVAYAALLTITLRLVLGIPEGHRTPAEWAGEVLARPFGTWILGGVAVVWMALGGIGQAVSALRGEFARDLDMPRLGRAERRWALSLGRIGLMARSITFFAVGVILLRAARHLGPQEPPDLAGGLQELLHQPFGRPLLLLVATGLMVFGTYAILCTRWARVRVARRAPDGAGAASPSHEVRR